MEDLGKNSNENLPIFLIEEPLAYLQYHFSDAARKKRDKFATEIIEVPGMPVLIFGEYHTAGPRNNEIQEFIEKHPGQITHLVLEISGDYQETLNRFKYGEISEENFKKSIRHGEEYFGLIEQAKKEIIEVMAGSPSGNEYEAWEKQYPDAAKELDGRQSERWIAMVPYNTKTTSEKIRKILEENRNAKILVFCGAGHVEYFLKYLSSSHAGDA